MRFDDRSKAFSRKIKEQFIEEFSSRIKEVNELTIRMHPLIHTQPGNQLCITGMRINSTLNLESTQWDPHIEGMNELHLILNEHACYKIYSNETSMQVKHSHFKSWENDTIKILYNNYEYESTRIECNLELTNPVLYALDKLNAMY